MSSTTKKDYKNTKSKQEEGPHDQAGFPESYEPLDGQSSDRKTAPVLPTNAKVKQPPAPSGKPSRPASTGQVPDKPLDSDQSERPMH